MLLVHNNVVQKEILKHLLQRIKGCVINALCYLIMNNNGPKMNLVEIILKYFVLCFVFG